MLEKLKALLKKETATASKAEEDLTKAVQHVEHHESEHKQALLKLNAAQTNRLTALTRLTKGEAVQGEVDLANKEVTLAQARADGWGARLERARAALREQKRTAAEARFGAQQAQEQYDAAWREETQTRLLSELFEAIRRHYEAQRALREFAGDVPNDGQVVREFARRGFLEDAHHGIDDWHKDFGIREFVPDPSLQTTTP